MTDKTNPPSELDQLKARNAQLESYIQSNRTDRQVLDSIERQINQLIQGLAKAISQKDSSEPQGK